MEILTLLGSPRKKGNTATILQAFEDCVQPEHRVRHIDLAQADIHGCLGCDACQRNMDEPGCKQKDDAPAILEQMIRADVLVYATPLYCWDFSAQMKLLIDRCYALTKWHDDRVVKSFLAGKRAMLLVTCGGGIENNADFIQGIFDRCMHTSGCDVIGKYIVPDCSTPQYLGSRVEQTAAWMRDDLNRVRV